MTHEVDKFLSVAKVLAPFLSPVFMASIIAADEAWTMLTRQRALIFLEEVVRRGVRPGIAGGQSQSDDRALHLLRLTFQAAINTHLEEKIKLFAQLYATFVRTGQFRALETYEDFTKILDDLSFTEFRLLALLAEFERLNPVEPSENELQRVSKYWDSFRDEACEKLLIPLAEFRSRVERLKRTGLLQGFDGSYWNGAQDKGYLTALYREFMTILKISPDDSEPEPSHT